MTERAGAALSHVPIRLGRIAFFSACAAANFSALAGSGFTETAGGNSLRRRTHGCMSYPQGTPASAWPFHRRITWRKLVFAGFDFCFQYYQVITGKYFMNI
ncbi:MAG: hypothetical protein ACXU8R_25065 [Xanthobacteraceae bacterium]